MKEVRRKGLYDNWYSNVRKKPSVRTRYRILKEQHGECNVCHCNIGTNGLAYEWDHVIPFCYSCNNSDDNFQALCVRCNRIGSGHVFDTKNIELAKFKKNQYILEKRLAEDSE